MVYRLRRNPIYTSNAIPRQQQINPDSERSKRKLIGKRETHLRMLQHVVEAKVLNLVFGRVDFLVAVLELRFDDKGRWVAEAAGGGMVRASVAALVQRRGCRSTGSC
jgi:hypothetical protein